MQLQARPKWAISVGVGQPYRARPDTQPATRVTIPLDECGSFSTDRKAWPIQADRREVLRTQFGKKGSYCDYSGNPKTRTQALRRCISLYGVVGEVHWREGQAGNDRVAAIAGVASEEVKLLKLVKLLLVLPPCSSLL